MTKVIEVTILNAGVLDVLKSLEDMNLLLLGTSPAPDKDLRKKTLLSLRGKVKKQNLEQLDAQLKHMRNEWD